ncbi:MAG: hypothetical protein DI533_08500 [Cereibacter sphaeroides]|uniref:Uncharacterized protein n=1 Tax=Cereibacter sphaeroides TaxID=1063 RepID=A0A2W5SLT4_CERSP|nr:MAG: hypothetical protein DI533_08500 [Cereibacter sphaeroides]
MTLPILASRVCKRLAAAAFALSAALCATQASADENEFRQFPFLVYCEFNGVTSAYYFSQLQNGQAIYLSPDRQIGVITLNGVADRVGGDRPGSCLDKTLDELRASGQAFDLPSAAAAP